MEEQLCLNRFTTYNYICNIIKQICYILFLYYFEDTCIKPTGIIFRTLSLAYAYMPKSLFFSVLQLGLYSLSRRTSYRNISSSLEGLDLFNRCDIWQAPRQRCCQDACHISERYNHYNAQVNGFETSQYLTVRRLTA